MTQVVETKDPILNRKFMVKVLVYTFTGKPFVRDNGFGGFYLTGYDSLGCYVWVPCDRDGNPIA
jgi:hypothetical protein